MTALDAYRDDGPLADALLRGAGEGARLGWLLPAIVRAVEYGGILAITRFAEPGEVPLAFALLAVLAFHHYDIVYRQRHRAEYVPRWVTLAGGGWEVRLAATGALAWLGALHAGLIVLSLGLGLLFVSESVWSWVRATTDGPATAGPGIAGPGLEADE